MTSSLPQDLMSPMIQQARAVVGSMQRLLHEVALEAPSTIATSSQFQTWMEGLRVYWQAHGPLHLGITPFHFWVDDVAWVESVDDVEQSLACWLYRAGLRSMSFVPTFSDSNALWLVVLLGQWVRQRPTLDLVSLLWTRHFEGFSYEEYNPVDESVVWDGWELEEIVRGLYELQEHDPLQKWNFSSQNHLQQPSFSGEFASSDSIDEMFGETFSLEEKESVQELLLEEEEQIPLRTSDLFLMVLMHCEKPEDIEPLQSWLEPIATSLVRHQMWYALTFLVEDLQQMEAQLPEAIQEYPKEMVAKLMDLLCQPEHLALVTQHLMAWSHLSVDEQEGLRLYLRLLASHATQTLDDMAVMHGEQVRQQLYSLISQPAWEGPLVEQEEAQP